MLIDVGLRLLILLISWFSKSLLVMSNSDIHNLGLLIHPLRTIGDKHVIVSQVIIASQLAIGAGMGMQLYGCLNAAV